VLAEVGGVGEAPAGRHGGHAPAGRQVGAAAFQAAPADQRRHAQRLALEELVQAAHRDVVRRGDLRRAEIAVAQARLDEPGDPVAHRLVGGRPRIAQLGAERDCDESDPRVGRSRRLVGAEAGHRPGHVAGERAHQRRRTGVAADPHPGQPVGIGGGERQR
jgi:hypothetical protein